ncbi:hypothetical protein PM10SUCC1_33090 [Propionigenium maris DSM 9537]|uniref:Teneurin-like YD-shell domain-containing protein n=1 Tax=Propionigenium maris DSM 9537 TaxID=1123000 RepID=A0A9W6GPH3_9FUSO|nr:RHS repeat-associated core domain-containing protein [Propionigenium maris]GLI57795.1 hypothetical protein PM10SUCC1_33090 [Propionigenium maris DSM 9537]
MNYIHGLERLPLLEIDENDSVIVNIFDDGELLCIEGEDSESYLLKDHLGSTRVVIDETTEKVGEFHYGDFGKTVTKAEPERSLDSIRYRYMGQEWDEEVEKYNYLARVYDPEIGRFDSLDPKREGFSPYVYVGDNPINFVDLDGKGLRGWLRGKFEKFGAWREGRRINRRIERRLQEESQPSISGVKNVFTNRYEEHLKLQRQNSTSVPGDMNRLESSENLLLGLDDALDDESLIGGYEESGYLDETFVNYRQTQNNVNNSGIFRAMHDSKQIGFILDDFEIETYREGVRIGAVHPGAGPTSRQFTNMEFMYASLVPAIKGKTMFLSAGRSHSLTTLYPDIDFNAPHGFIQRGEFYARHPQNTVNEFSQDPELPI